MNMAESFAEFLEDYLTELDDDANVYIGGVPQDAENKAWWIVSSGGTPEDKNQTGELIKNYTLSVYYRNTEANDVYDKLHDLEVEVNKANCTQLQGFDTIEMQGIVFPADQDIDSEDRTVGLLQVTIRTYYKE